MAPSPAGCTLLTQFFWQLHTTERPHRIHCVLISAWWPLPWWRVRSVLASRGLPGDLLLLPQGILQHDRVYCCRQVFSWYYLRERFRARVVPAIVTRSGIIRNIILNGLFLCLCAFKASKHGNFAKYFLCYFCLANQCITWVLSAHQTDTYTCRRESRWTHCHVGD